MQKPTYYDILGIDITATSSDIQSVYRKLVIEYHPDVVGESENATKKMALVNIAYETLHDPEKRKRYNDSLITHSPKSQYANNTSQSVPHNEKQPSRKTQEGKSFQEKIQGFGQATLSSLRHFSLKKYVLVYIAFTIIFILPIVRLASTDWNYVLIACGFLSFFFIYFLHSWYKLSLRKRNILTLFVFCWPLSVYFLIVTSIVLTGICFLSFAAVTFNFFVKQV